MLKITYGTRKAAEYACKNWHYSKCLPGAGLVIFNVYEDEKFIGVVIYSKGANNHIGTPYKLKQHEVCELTRVALSKHKISVSKILSVTFRLLKKDFPNIRLIVSYADSNQGHLGKIYQASNWIYEGESKTNDYYVDGQKVHKRTLASHYGSYKISLLSKKFQNIKILSANPKY